MLTIQQLVRRVNTHQRRMSPLDLIRRLDQFRIEFREGGKLSLTPKDQNAPHLALGAHAKSQLLARLGIPERYFDSCPIPLKRAQVDWFLKAEGSSKVLLRTVNGDKVRALLSSTYAVMDDADLVPQLADVLADETAQVQIADQGEALTHIRILFPKVAEEVRPGDFVQTGLHFTNSEVGIRAVRIEPLVFRLVCKNGAVRAERWGHTGFRHSGDPGRLKDAVFAAVAAAKLQSLVLAATLRKAALHKVMDPVALIEARAAIGGMSRDQVAQVLDAFKREPMSTLFGVHSAFTRAAKGQATVEARFQVERLGAGILDAT